MNYRIHEIQGKYYIELISTDQPIRTENDALDLVALCGEHATSLLMIHHAALSADFFDLRTRAAGHIIQKLLNYAIKTVALIPLEKIQAGRFREMALEINQGRHFRIYDDREEAEAWLLN